jgi:hypothetical protein
VSSYLYGEAVIASVQKARFRLLYVTGTVQCGIVQYCGTVTVQVQKSTRSNRRTILMHD